MNMQDIKEISRFNSFLISDYVVEEPDATIVVNCKCMTLDKIVMYAHNFARMHINENNTYEIKKIVCNAYGCRIIIDIFK